MDKTSPMKSKPLVDCTCKLGTKGCFTDGRCHAIGNCKNKIVTKADRVRAMSDEELAIMFAILRADLSRLDAAIRPYSGRDVNDNYDWLKQPADEDVKGENDA